MASFDPNELGYNLSGEEKANFLQLVDKNNLLKSFNNVICSGNITFFDSFIKYTGIDGNVDVLENLISEAYSELKLRNVSFNSAMEQHVEKKLIELQFFYSNDAKNKEEVKVSLDDAKTRIDLTCKLIEKMLSKYSVKNYKIFNSIKFSRSVVPEKAKGIQSIRIDAEFLLIGRFVAQNIHILKRQLKGTYTILPWEEIEFLLVCFMSSLKNPEDSDVIYKLVLDREIILKHLNHFRIKLNEVKQGLKEKDVHFKEKLGGRGKIIRRIIRETPDFEDLYKDHDLLKSVYSLKRINLYICIALSFDENSNVGDVETLLLERTLQVIGESLKNTPDSPNVSERVHNILSQDAPRHARELSTALRDCLSHSHSFTRRPMQDASFCLKLQEDLKKINKQIQHILYTMKIEAIKVFLKKILTSKRIEEIQDLVRSLVEHQFGDSINAKTINLSEESLLLKQLFEAFKSIVTDRSGVTILFEEAEEILDWHKNSLTEIKTNYLEGINQVKNLVNLCKSNSLCFHDIKDMAESCLDTMSPDKMTQAKLKRFVNITSAIGLTVMERSDPGVSETDTSLKMKHLKLERIVYEIYAVVEFMAGRISGIDHFKNNIGKREEDEIEANEVVDQTFKSILGGLELEKDKLTLQKEFENGKRIYKAKKVLVKIFNSKVKGKECDFNEAVKSLKLNARNANRLLTFYENYDFVQCKELVQKIEDHHGQFAKTIEDLSLFSQETYKNNVLAFFQSFKIKENAKKNLMEIVDRHIEKREEEITKYFNGRLKVLETLILNGDTQENRSVINNIAIEMLTLELTEILENMKFFGDGKLFLDQSCPLLIGKNLRNYLAHGDALIDSLPFRPSRATDHCANLLIKLGGDLLTKKDIIIGRSIATDFNKLSKTYDRGFQIVFQQDEMFKAIRQNDLEGVKHCVLNGADPKRADVNCWTGLHFAAELGNIPLLEYFLENGVSLDIKDFYGKTPLHIAYDNDRIDLIQYFVDKQTFVSKDIDVNGGNFLHLAARLGRDDIVRGMRDDIDDVDKGNVCKQTALHLSCLGGHADVVCLLLEMGASVFADSMLGEKPLHYAAQNGHKRVVQIILETGADPTAAAYNGWTSLHHAANHGHPNVIKTLLKDLKDSSSMCDFIDAPTDKKMRALHLAVESGHRDVVEVLLHFNCSVSFKDCANMTALHYAYRGGHASIIDLLVNAGATLIETDESDSWKNVHFAAMHGHVDVLEQLLRSGNSAGDADPVNGYTALHRAATMGHLEVLMLLLEYKAPICAKAHNGCTALHLAVRYNHPDAVKMLITRAAQIQNSKIMHQNKMSDLVNATNEDCSTALHIAVAMEHEICVRHLINGGADINAKDITGCSALHIAARYGLTNILNILIHGGCDLNAVSKDSWTALHFAADNGHFDAVKLLIEKESKLDILSNNNETILHCAVAKDFRNIVEFVLKSVKKEDKKSFVNTRQGKEKQTALHFAVKNGLKKITSMLLENEADTEILDCKDHSALVFAAVTGHVDILSELLAKGASINTKEPSVETKEGIFDVKDTSVKTKGANNVEGVSVKNKGQTVKTKEVAVNAEEVSITNKGRTVKTKKGAINAKGVSVKNEEGSVNAKELCAKASVNDEDASVAIKDRRRDLLVEETSVKTIEGAVNTKGVLITNKEGTVNTKLSAKDSIIAEDASVETKEGFINYEDISVKNKKGSVNAAGPSIKTNKVLPNTEDISVKTKERSVNAAGASVKTKEVLPNTEDISVKTKEGFVNIKDLSAKDSVIAEKTSINAPLSHMNISVCLAAGNGHLEALKLLINAGADLKSCDGKGNTAFHWAVKNKRVEVVEFLIEKGIDVDVANNDGLTPFQLAAQTSCKSIVKILLLNNRKSKTSLQKFN